MLWLIKRHLKGTFLCKMRVPASQSLSKTIIQFAKRDMFMTILA